MMPPPEILVLGAPGNVGTPMVFELLQSGVPLRIGAYDVARARSTFAPNGDDGDVDIVAFDFLDPATYADAFVGIKRMFLVRPPALSNVPRDIAPAIQAAADAGVEHIVFLSIQGVENNRWVPHRKIEEAIVAAGVHYTFLRASFFMQNLSTTHAAEIRDRGEIALPVGKAKTSFIDARDIAAVAARALTEPGHADRRYTLTGQEALDYFQVAGKLSQGLGRPIRYTHPFIVRFVVQQVRMGQALKNALVMALLYTITRMGNAAAVTPDTGAILGRPPISLDQFVLDYRDCWAAASS